ncbi:MAG: hypothetical protein ABJC10_09210 [Acidobacteriota bacterium]
MKTISKPTIVNANWSGQRGAALITMLLVSLLILTAGGTLIITTAMTATNTVDAAAEIQAYYAAEAGNQAVLNVLRGNVAPNPVFATDPYGGVAPENKISFRRAVTIDNSNLSTDTAAPRLSRWMTYDTTYNPARVILSSGYTPVNGMAFSAVLSDPDNSSVVTFSTSGLFDNNTATKAFGSGNTRATLTYSGQASATINTTGTSTFGGFTISSVGPGGYILVNEPFKLTVTQTAPWPVTYTINCTLSGTIIATTSIVAVTFPALTNNLQGTLYTRALNPILSTGATPMSVTVTAPEPNRIVANVAGYGPRNARKQMRMLLSRFAFDISAPSAITIRSADDNSQLTFNQGNSARYQYNGNDNAGGADVTAFGVTGAADYAYLTSLSLPGSQVFGNPSGFRQVAVTELPAWLQTADAARAFVNDLRNAAQNESRYYTTGSQPADFGTTSRPLLTFVDGDTDLSPAGGSGLLVVTGTLTLDGSSAYSGLILVLGGGQLIRTGGGNGNSFGAALVARFGNTGNFLAPTFNSNGSGTSSIQYDSDWIRRGLASTGPRVMAIGEF